MINNQNTLIKQKTTQETNQGTNEETIFQDKGPILKTNIRKSNDNKWLIHETIITDIKPITYFEKVFQ
jgi:hypothetical protein